MNANDYVRRYHQIQVPEFEPSVMYRLFGTKIVPAPVREYVNLRLGDESSPHKPPKAERMDFKDKLLSFFKGVAKEKDSGIVFNGNGLHLYCSVMPVVNFKLESFMYCFGGKASAELMAGMVQLLSFWRGWRIHVDRRTNVPSLQDLVFRYLGVDCNGFVGNYIGTKFPATHVVPSTISSEYDRLAKVKRHSPFELQDDDVIVFTVTHIAVINFVEVATDSEALVEVSEARTARTKNGGPQTNSFTLKYNKGTWSFSPPREKSVKSIVRVNGMS